MLYVVFGTSMLVVLAFVASRAGGNSRFPHPPEGSVAGTWAFAADPEAKTVSWQLRMADDKAADFVAYFVQWQLFYFGNGSEQHDTSAPLRLALREILDNPIACTWTAATNIAGGDQVLNLDGEFWNGHGFESFPGVIGGPRKSESLHGATVGVLQQALVGPHADRVRRSVSTLLQWHQELGPAHSTDEIAPRAFASLQAGSSK